MTRAKCPVKLLTTRASLANVFFSDHVNSDYDLLSDRTSVYE